MILRAIVSSRAALVAAAVMAMNCGLASPTEPALSGPSALALSVAVTASPALIPRDGTSLSVIVVNVHDAKGQPIRNMPMRMDIAIGGTLADFGALSSRNISTGSDGKATVLYTAPPPAPFGASNEATVQIIAWPIESSADYANSNWSGVSVRLTSPGIILPPNGTPVPSFFVSPSSPREQEAVSFDGSASKDDSAIVKYTWTFGDGTSSSGTSPVTSHTYGVAGAYQVTLMVTDDLGVSATTTPTTVTVVAADKPVASFTFSPTTLTLADVVNFNAASSSVPPGREIRTWQWDFGDGTSATLSSPTATHQYSVAKTFTVTLTVIDDIGRRATTSMTVTINP